MGPGNITLWKVLGITTDSKIYSSNPHRPSSNIDVFAEVPTSSNTVNLISCIKVLFVLDIYSGDLQNMTVIRNSLKILPNKLTFYVKY